MEQQGKQVRKFFRTLFLSDFFFFLFPFFFLFFYHLYVIFIGQLLPALIVDGGCSCQANSRTCQHDEQDVCDDPEDPQYFFEHISNTLNPHARNEEKARVGAKF